LFGSFGTPSEQTPILRQEIINLQCELSETKHKLHDKTSEVDSLCTLLTSPSKFVELALKNPDLPKIHKEQGYLIGTNLRILPWINVKRLHPKLYLALLEYLGPQGLVTSLCRPRA
jgi:hypothetical protein